MKNNTLNFLLENLYPLKIRYKIILLLDISRIDTLQIRTCKTVLDSLSPINLDLALLSPIVILYL